MSATRCCEQCGAALPPRAPAGLCPRCLLGQAVHAPAEFALAVPAPAKPPETEPGRSSVRRLGDYELLEKIARGGMGVVYKARQLRLNRIVALKMIPPGRLAGEEAIARFQAEAEAAASLQHPHIVPIHETGQWEDQHYFSMDYVAGENLADAVRTQPLPPARAAQVLKAIAEAVHYAHQKGILHRDLKPSNIILDEAGEPHVTDFGLAKRLGGDSALTLTGQVIGSPGFMPPEQAGGQQSAVDVRSDVYGLGAVLYYVLVGRPPFQADTLTTLLKQVAETEPVSLRLLNPSIPRDLENICLKCLEKEPSGRYLTAQALAEELGRFLEGKPVLARPVGRLAKTGRWCRRNPRLTAAVGLAVLSLLIGLAGVSWQWRRAEAERARAKAGELLARQNTYTADMHLAQLALDNNNRLLTASLLEKHRPNAKSGVRSQKSEVGESRKQKAEIDLRGWEWRYLWQFCQGDESFTLCRCPNGITQLAVSRDRRFLAIATWGRGELWDLASRQRVSAFDSGPFSALAFSPTADVLAMGTRAAAGQFEIRLWDLSAGKMTKTLEREAEVASLAFSPDGRWLASSERGGSIQVVAWQSARTITNLTAPPRGPVHLAFSPDGGRLAVGEEFGRTRLVDLHTGTTTYLKPQLTGVLALAFSPAADLLAASYASEHGTIVLYDSRTGEARDQLTNHAIAPSALVFTPDGSQLASASGDGTIRIWNVADQRQLCRLQSAREGLTALAMLPDGKTLVSGGSGGSVSFWDATASNRASPHTRIRVSADASAFTELEPASYASGRLDPRAVCRLGVAFTPDSHRFITMDTNGALALWDIHPARLIEPLPALGSNHWGVALSPDGHWLATGECLGTITIWDWPARRVVTNFSSPFEWFCFMRFSRNGHYLNTVDFNDQLVTRARLWRTTDWTEVPLKEGQSAGLWCMEVSPDDRFLAGGYADGKVKLFRLASGEPEAVFAGHPSPVTGVSFLPDGRSLASTSTDGSARLWDVVARQELTPAPLPGHAGVIWNLALSPDGRRWATGGEDPGDAVKLWDPVVHRGLITLRGDGLFFVDVHFSPDGNTVVATGMRGFANLWHAPSWEEIEAAEKGQKAQ